MNDMNLRDFSKRGDAIKVPNLVRVQLHAYDQFLQLDVPHDKRDRTIGLESLLNEVFPIEGRAAMTNMSGALSPLAILSRSG